MPEDATLDAFASRDAAESDGDENAAADEAEVDEAEVDGATEKSRESDDPTADSAVGSSENVEGPTDTVEEPAEESAVDVSDVEPARSTFDWTPDGGECADCGASAERRWRADGQKDGGLVCGDCKEW